MTFTVTDKRGTGTRKSGVPQETVVGPEGDEHEVPGWWPELIAVDTELHSASAKHGEPTQQGNTFATFGHPVYGANAREFKRINDVRSTEGKPGQWAKIILEEQYEALEIEPTEENAAKLYNELIQAAAMNLAAAEDLRVKFS